MGLRPATLLFLFTDLSGGVISEPTSPTIIDVLDGTTRSLSAADRDRLNSAEAIRGPEGSLRGRERGLRQSFIEIRTGCLVGLVAEGRD